MTPHPTYFGDILAIKKHSKRRWPLSQQYFPSQKESFPAIFSQHLLCFCCVYRFCKWEYATSISHLEIRDKKWSLSTEIANKRNPYSKYWIKDTSEQAVMWFVQCSFGSFVVHSSFQIKSDPFHQLGSLTMCPWPRMGTIGWGNPYAYVSIYMYLSLYI